MIIDEEELEFLTQQEDGVRITDLTIYGYFALALKVLSVPQEYSNSKRKMIDGFGAKIRGEIISDFPCYLIGQLSRNSNVPEDSISGKELTEKAISVIKSSMISVGGRAVLVECRNKKKLISFYKENGFSLVDSDWDGEDKMIQMLLVIDEEL